MVLEVQGDKEITRIKELIDMLTMIEEVRPNYSISRSRGYSDSKAENICEYSIDVLLEYLEERLIGLEAEKRSWEPFNK